MNDRVRDVEHYFNERPKSKARYGLIRAYLRGRTFEFLTASGVFSKKRIDSGTRLLVESMVLPKKGCALDIGCGYGAVGIVAAAAERGLEVYLVDVNVRAVWLARQNVEKNRISNSGVRRGFLYEPVQDLTFNCILSNPPVSSGMQTVKSIILEAPAHMKSNATFQMVLRSKVAGKRLCAFFEAAFGRVEILARESGYRVLLSKKE
jgi:16S rRNA (guanine1207-N2)-methyltransferase